MGVREVARMSNASLVGVKACVFDAYGTLFDFAAAAKGCRDMLGESVEKLTALWRDKQLQYTWLRALQSRHADFWQVTADALDFALETLAIEKPGLRDRRMNLYLTLDASPEVGDVLTRLKQAGLRTAILSNGSPKCSMPPSRPRGWSLCSMQCSQSRRLASTSRTPRSISSPSTVSRCRLPPSH